MRARYDLAKYPTNFNFLEWLVAAKSLGATSVLFDDSQGYRPKYHKDEIRKRLDSILIPACALAGLPHEFGAGAGMDPGYHMSAVLRVHMTQGPLQLLESVLPPAKVDYTITLRNSKRYPERNSDDKAWRKFGDEIGAVVVEEFDDKPIHLHERMALYAGARMNFFVANGPMYLCWFSRYPHLSFMKNVNAEYHAKYLFPVGSQLPWFRWNQRCVWGGDSYDEIKKAWNALGELEGHAS